MSDLAISGSQKTIQQIIDENSTSSSKRNTGDLGKDDFLNLLVTQLRYQDPLNPTDDKEFIGQMAQFSALEQMQNLNLSFTATKAYGLIGKSVTANIVDPSTKETTVLSGDVSSVKINGRKYYVVVRGTEVLVDEVTNVTESSFSSQSNLAAYTNLLGFNVNGIVYNSADGDMIKVSGTVKALQKGAYEDYAIMDGVSVEIAGLNTAVKTTDAEYVKNTLTAAYENGSEISIIIKDSSTGKKVPVTAKIINLDIASNGKITAVLNNVHVPLESITNITKPVETTTDSSESDTEQTADTSTDSTEQAGEEDGD